MSLNFGIILFMGLFAIACGLYGLYDLRENPEKEMFGGYGTYYTRDYYMFMMLVILGTGVFLLFFAFSLPTV